MRLVSRSGRASGEGALWQVPADATLIPNLSDKFVEHRAEATFKADLEKLLKDEGHMPEDKFLVMSRKGKRLGVAFARYHNGRGEAQDYAEAMRRYRLAARQGNARAQVKTET